MRRIYLFFTSLFLFSQISIAQWNSDPAINNLISPNDSPIQMQMISDGSGGAIIVWANSLFDVYVQRINSGGQTLWPVPGSTDGILVCAFSSPKLFPVLATDGSNGAIVVWGDGRSGSLQLFAQKIDATGAIQWDPDGVRVCDDDGTDQLDHLVVSDGSGGAIIAWDDIRFGDPDIFAQKIDGSGAVLWAPDGVEICTEQEDQAYPDLAPDGNGGAIIAWEDLRDPASNDIYAQKVDLNGSVQWTPGGIQISADPDDEGEVYIIEDGNNGAIIVWETFDAGCGCTSDIYAQKINSDSTAAWAPGGVPVVVDGEDQSYISAVLDGSGGAIITWQDSRTGTSYDIYAQKINGAGLAQWTANGIPIIQAADEEKFPSIASDGSNGAIITWEMEPSGGCGCDVNIFSQKIDALGAKQWAAGGLPVTTAIDGQSYSLLVSDDNGGAISSWIDLRDFPDSKIFASRIRPDGMLPVELNSFSGMLINNSVVLNWTTANEVNNYGFEIERQAGSQQSSASSQKQNPWEKIGFVKGSGNTSSSQKYSFVDKGVISDTVYYRLKQVDTDGKFKYSEKIQINVSVPVNFTLYQNYPNPFNPSTKIKFDIPGTQGILYPVSLSVFDILGNKVADLVNNSLEAGSHEVEFNSHNDHASGLASGVYFAQLEWNGKKQMKKMLLQK